MLELKQAGFAYSPRFALHRLNLSLPPGAKALLRGPNGAGKTTLLRLLAGLLPLHGGALSGLPGAGRVFICGHYPPVCPALSLKENLQFWPALSSRLGDIAPAPAEAVSEILRRFNLSGMEAEKAGRLSRGAIQRLALAGICLAAAQCEASAPADGASCLILLDEPETALEPRCLTELQACLAGLSRATVIWTSHSRFAEADTASSFLFTHELLLYAADSAPDASPLFAPAPPEPRFPASPRETPDPAAPLSRAILNEGEQRASGQPGRFSLRARPLPSEEPLPGRQPPEPLPASESPGRGQGLATAEEKKFHSPRSKRFAGLGLLLSRNLRLAFCGGSAAQACLLGLLCMFLFGMVLAGPGPERRAAPEPAAMPGATAMTGASGKTFPAAEATDIAGVAADLSISPVAVSASDMRDTAGSNKKIFSSADPAGTTGVAGAAIPPGATGVTGAGDAAARPAGATDTAGEVGPASDAANFPAATESKDTTAAAQPACTTNATDAAGSAAAAPLPAMLSDGNNESGLFFTRARAALFCLSSLLAAAIILPALYRSGRDCLSPLLALGLPPARLWLTGTLSAFALLPLLQTLWFAAALLFVGSGAVHAPAPPAAASGPLLPALPAWLAAGLFLFNWGVCCLTALLTPLAQAQTRGGAGRLLPLLLIPLCAPLLLKGMEIFQAAFVWAACTPDLGCALSGGLTAGELTDGGLAAALPAGGAPPSGATTAAAFSPGLMPAAAGLKDALLFLLGFDLLSAAAALLLFPFIMEGSEI